MSGGLDAATARRLLRQQAETARFLGVDFVPLGHAGAGADGAPGDAGADGPAQAEPVDKFAVSWRAVEVKPLERTPGIPAGRVVYRPIDVPQGPMGREAAQALLDTVRARYEADAPHQHFVTDHHSIVFGEGDPCADLMFVGEAPGETEDQTGRPFVGKAGQLLDKMIVAMGLSREGVYICNVLKTRPPNNATPTAEEAALCAPYLLDQVRVVRPRVIVALGLPASRMLLGTDEPMRSLRGRFHALGGAGGIFAGAPDVAGIRVMPTYHPAYLLRSYTEENRRKVWSDLKMVMEALGAG